MDRCSRFVNEPAELVYVTDHGQDMQALLAENTLLRAANTALENKISMLNDTMEGMTRKIAELEKKLGRNSQNSSMPPSSDTFGTAFKPESPNRKARRALGRKPGKQPGSPGAHLAQVEVPDHIVSHRPEMCSCCGADLFEAEIVGEEVRQVFDIPEPKVEVTEHRVFKLRCLCGQLNEGTFPKEARAQAGYGPRVRAFGLYLLARQHLPFERAAEAMEDLLGLSCSTGFLDDCYR